MESVISYSVTALDLALECGRSYSRSSCSLELVCVESFGDKILVYIHLYRFVISFKPLE
jgi:hypothetical protein